MRLRAAPIWPTTNRWARLFAPRLIEPSISLKGVAEPTAEHIHARRPRTELAEMTLVVKYPLTPFFAGAFRSLVAIHCFALRAFSWRDAWGPQSQTCHIRFGWRSSERTWLK